MKIRDGFVSNSSSSSFVIFKRNIDVSQLGEIRNHSDVAGGEEWNIEEDKWQIRCFTSMDNFDMEEFLEKIGVKQEFIEWMAY